MFKFSLPLQRSSWVSPFPVHHGPTSKPPGRSRQPALPNSPTAAHTAQKARSKATSEGLRSGGVEVTTALWTPVAIWGSNCRLYDAMTACGSPSTVVDAAHYLECYATYAIACVFISRQEFIMPSTSAEHPFGEAVEHCMATQSVSLSVCLHWILQFLVIICSNLHFE